MGCCASTYPAHIHADYNQDDLDGIAAELNGRPRQTLDFKTPSEALTEVLR
jgi:IS30 family transposase